MSPYRLLSARMKIQTIIYSLESWQTFINGSGHQPGTNPKEHSKGITRVILQVKVIFTPNVPYSIPGSNCFIGSAPVTRFVKVDICNNLFVEQMPGEGQTQVNCRVFLIEMLITCESNK